MSNFETFKGLQGGYWPCGMVQDDHLVIWYEKYEALLVWKEGLVLQARTFSLSPLHNFGEQHLRDACTFQSSPANAIIEGSLLRPYQQQRAPY
eukprot:1137313-Pelagomonas_calceolata.AAC.1